MAHLQFLGATQTVTGSKTLLDHNGKKVLIDCGLFQGLKSLRLKNWEPFPISPEKIDAVLLTHAHLDHTGYLPLLVKNGFTGKIYCSDPTADLTRLILTDSAHIQEEDAEYANYHGYSKHKPAKPLYTLAHVERALKQIETVSENTYHELFPNLRYTLIPNGHILGSTCIQLELLQDSLKPIRVVFTGDLGRSKSLLHPAPTFISEADYLITESTYGDRIKHPELDLKKISDIIWKTYNRGGHVIIPSFAVGRVQEVLLILSQLKLKNLIPHMPIYLDTPMGTNATEIYLDHPNWHKLTKDEMTELCTVATIVKTRKQSVEVMKRPEPIIVIAGSGMLTGGRVLHHLDWCLGDSKHSILLVGFQAAATRGRLLFEGISEVKMHGRYIPVRAEIHGVFELSAHADQTELIHWYRGFKSPPKQTYLIHGEPQAIDALRVRISDTLKWPTHIPEFLESVALL